MYKSIINQEDLFFKNFKQNYDTSIKDILGDVVLAFISIHICDATLSAFTWKLFEIVWKVL